MLFLLVWENIKQLIIIEKRNKLKRFKLKRRAILVFFNMKEFRIKKLKKSENLLFHNCLSKKFIKLF